VANTYHLMLRPGARTVAALGGLHKMMAWDSPSSPTAAGSRFFSLAELRKIDDAGVRFQSHIDGSEHLLTPRSAIELQSLLGPT